MATKKINKEMLVRIIKTGASIEDICFVFNVTEKELEPFRNIIEENALSEEEYIKKRIVKAKKSGLIDPTILNKLRQSIKMQIADMIAREMGNVEELIGYPIELIYFDFIDKFPKDYNWDNWGSIWHIDHIKPRCQFSTTELKECFNLNNLRPLDKYENMSRKRKK